MSIDYTAFDRARGQWRLSDDMAAIRSTIALGAQIRGRGLTELYALREVVEQLSQLIEDDIGIREEYNQDREERNPDADRWPEGWWIRHCEEISRLAEKAHRMSLVVYRAAHHPSQG